jgi:dolichyl-phosphate-mannose-protein mannosyltransferase
MFQHNANLKDDHPFASNPFTWPFVLRGVSFWQNKDTNAQIYFMGNVVVWYSVNFVISLYLAIMLVDLLFLRRGIDNFGPVIRYRLLMGGGFLVGAYFLHFAPFFIMGRVLFLHHYLPSVIFGSLVAGFVFDFFFGKESPRQQVIYALIPICMTIGIFLYFLPLSLGWEMTPESIATRQWLKSWDFGFVKSD